MLLASVSTSLSAWKSISTASISNGISDGISICASNFAACSVTSVSVKTRITSSLSPVPQTSAIAVLKFSIYCLKVRGGGAGADAGGGWLSTGGAGCSIGAITSGAGSAGVELSRRD